MLKVPLNVTGIVLYVCMHLKDFVMGQQGNRAGYEF